MINSSSIRLTLRFLPVRTDADVDRERYDERCRRLHLIADDAHDVWRLIFWNLEQQLVVNGQDHTRVRPGLQRRMDVDHGPFHDICGGSLNGKVDGNPLGGRTHLPVAAGQLRHEAPPAVHRPDDAARARLFEKAVDERADAWKTGEVCVDEFLRGLWR